MRVEVRALRPEDAFPRSMRVLVPPSVARFKPSDRRAVLDAYRCVVGGEVVYIPQRFEWLSRLFARPVSRGSILRVALRTRDCDGRIRQAAATELVRQAPVEPWVVPFQMLAAGDYVVEVLQAMLPYVHLRAHDYARFVADNKRVCQAIFDRMVSYWDYGYRSRWPDIRQYPGFRLLDAMQCVPDIRSTARLYRL